MVHAFHVFSREYAEIVEVTWSEYTFDFTRLRFQIIFWSQFFTDFPELNLPDLKLYMPRQTWISHTPSYDLLKFFTYTAHASEISLYGIDNLRVNKIEYLYVNFIARNIWSDEIYSFRYSGIGPSQNYTNLYSEVSIPWFKFSSPFNANVEMLSFWDFRPVAIWMQSEASSSFQFEFNWWNCFT